MWKRKLSGAAAAAVLLSACFGSLPGTASAAPVIANMPHRANGSKITAPQKTPRQMPAGLIVAGKEKIKTGPQASAPTSNASQDEKEGETSAAPRITTIPRAAQAAAPLPAVTEKPTPVAEKPDPVVEKPASVAEKPAPAPGNSAVVQEPVQIAPPAAAQPPALSAQPAQNPSAAAPAPSSVPSPGAVQEKPGTSGSTAKITASAAKAVLPKPSAPVSNRGQKPETSLKWEKKAKTAIPAKPKPAPAENKSVYKVGDKGWKVKQAQRYLLQLGFAPGEADGLFTKSTRKALRKFQAKYKLKVTGNLDNATYEELKWQIESKEYGGNVASIKILKTAARFRGVPYLWGGTTPNGFDCSGFVQYVFAQNGIRLTRTADTQALEGKHVAKKDLKPGDLVFFSTYEPGASHDGIYAGNGKFWNATSSRGVMLCDLNDSYWGPRYYTARRILRSNGR